MKQIFNALSRKTPYETAKILMDRKDNIERPYTYPEMKSGYPTMKVKPSAGAYGLLQSILP